MVVHVPGAEVWLQVAPDARDATMSKAWKPPPRKPKKPRAPSGGRFNCLLLSALIVALGSACAGALRYWPWQSAVLVHRAKLALGATSMQLCPAAGDRFYDHCAEGRQHYLIRIDWGCLGDRRAAAMQMAFSMENDGKPLRGVGNVPAWLTEDNAKAVSVGPCMRGIDLDLACQHCVPQPKAAEAAEEAGEKATARATAATTAEEDDGVGADASTGATVAES